MPLWTTIAALTVALLLVGTGLAWLWQRRSLADLVDSVSKPASGQASRSEVQATADLPNPVARYLRAALAPEKGNIRLARYEQAGALRTDPRSDRWMSFTAHQVISPASFAFVWDARVSIMPLVHVRVRDSLLEGRGAGQVTVLSAIPVAAAGGNVEMNSGSLHRFLAEAVWYPTALLPGPHLQWQPMDDRRALATLTSRGISVSLEFRFNDNDEVTGIYSPGRWGSFDGGYRQVAWEGKFTNYAKHSGVLVPAAGEVGWYMDGEWRCVWRGAVTRAVLEFE